MAGWFIITHHNFPQDSLSINWGTIPAWLSDGIWEQVKKKGRNKVALLHGETGAHTCRTDTNKTGNENVLQGKEAHREAGGFWGEKRSRNGIYMLCMCLFGGKGCGGMYCTYLMPAACLQWLSCLAWQSSWELLKGDRIRMESQAHRSPGWTEGNVLGPRPEGVYILSAFTASRSWIPKRKHATVFWARPPDVPFSKEEGLCELFFFLFYAHTCLWSHAFSTAIHPPFPSPSLGAVSSPIVSIQLAVITNSSLITEFIWLVENNGGSRLSFHSPCHQYCLPLWRELNGACLWGMRRTRQKRCLALFFWTS